MSANPPVDPRTYLRVVGLGAAIRIPAGLLAAGFLALVHRVRTAADRREAATTEPPLRPRPAPAESSPPVLPPPSGAAPSIAPHMAAEPAIEQWGARRERHPPLSQPVPSG